MEYSLYSLPDGSFATIFSIVDMSINPHLFDMGLFEGAKIYKIKNAPFSGPCIFSVLNSVICIRKCDADKILCRRDK